MDIDFQEEKKCSLHSVAHVYSYPLGARFSAMHHIFKQCSSYISMEIQVAKRMLDGF